MMLPESDWPRLWADPGGLRDPCRVSVFGVDVTSGCAGVAWLENPGLSQGCGETRCSAGAETGVGRVDDVMAVVADLGVTPGCEPEIGVYGVKGVRVLGESSALGARQPVSWETVFDLSRVIESFRAS